MAPRPQLAIGARGSRDRLPTPALVIDRDVLRSNVAAMSRPLDGTGVSHRPHFKAHKCLEICRLQCEFGARSEEHTSELQSRQYLVCRLLLEKKKQHTRLFSTISNI